jgi:uridine phosphorylase
VSIIGLLEEIPALTFSLMARWARVPKRLRPTAQVAADAVLVGDPGRSLLLAQELLEAPKMSNHARGLWGYWGKTAAGDELTVQTTGIGGPSAAAVLTDLAKLGVRRAVRIGTCAGIDPATQPGELLLVSEAIAAGGSASSFGVGAGESVLPDLELLEGLRSELGEEAREVPAASFDTMPPASATEVTAADMQTVAVLASARRLGIAAAAILIVVETAAGERRVSDEELALAATRAGEAASAVLSGSS